LPLAKKDTPPLNHCHLLPSRSAPFPPEADPFFFPAGLLTNFRSPLFLLSCECNLIFPCGAVQRPPPPPLPPRSFGKSPLVPTWNPTRLGIPVVFVFPTRCDFPASVDLGHSTFPPQIVVPWVGPAYFFFSVAKHAHLVLGPPVFLLLTSTVPATIVYGFLCRLLLTPKRTNGSGPMPQKNLGPF